MTSLPETPEPTETRAKLLESAFRLLVRDGYFRVSTRDIAAEAGVNHALVHYYFGTKDQLVIAALDQANRALVIRQERMYAAPGGFAEKWALARAFYAEDLASGFVRVQTELWAASISNPRLRAEVLPRLRDWQRVVHAAVQEALAVYRLDLPVSSEVLATWIVGFWAGMEFAMIAGMTDEQGHFTEALDAMQRLLKRLDQEAGLSPGEAADGSEQSDSSP